MVRLGCLLILVGMAALMAIVVLPVLPFTEADTNIDDFLGSFICTDGQLQRELYQTSYRPGSTSFSMEVFCQRGEERTDVTTNWILLGIFGFTVPFIIGLFLVIGGTTRHATRAVASMANVTVTTTNGTTRVIHLGDLIDKAHTIQQNQSDLTLAERLKQLEDARAQGLISEEEYERLRKEILQDGI